MSSPDEEPWSEEPLVKVWESYGEVDAQLVKSLLAGYGIDCVLKGEAVRYIHGFTHTKLGRVEILVKAADAEEARLIIQQPKKGNKERAGSPTDEILETQEPEED